MFSNVLWCFLIFSCLLYRFYGQTMYIYPIKKFSFAFVLCLFFFVISINSWGPMQWNFLVGIFAEIWDLTRCDQFLMLNRSHIPAACQKTDASAKVIYINFIFFILLKLFDFIHVKIGLGIIPRIGLALIAILTWVFISR